ncbi:hypothetical protein FRC09_020384 [Ceratobasidium sp. 395]|nr:hypothetical protein FRC09_020384 [Ceratobasidium sp. 395]
MEDDIQMLAASLCDLRVYELVPGCAFNPEDLPPKDVVSEGYRRLAHGSERTIGNYNEYFKNLQKRFKISPLSSEAPQTTPSQYPAQDENAPEPEAGGQDDPADPAQDQDTADGTQEPQTTTPRRKKMKTTLWRRGHRRLGFSDEDVHEDEELDEDEDVAPSKDFDSDESL